VDECNGQGRGRIHVEGGVECSGHERKETGKCESVRLHVCQDLHTHTHAHTSRYAGARMSASCSRTWSRYCRDRIYHCKAQLWSEVILRLHF